MKGSQGAMAGFVFISIAAIAVYAMLRASAEPGGSANRTRLIQLHRYTGYAFIALFCAIVYFMAMRLKGVAEEPSARVTVHMLFAFLLAPLLTIKVLIARYYRQYSTALFPLGIAIAGISFALVAITLAPHFLERAEPGRLPVYWALVTLLPIFAGLVFLARSRPGSRRTVETSREPDTAKAPRVVLRLARIEPNTSSARTLRFRILEGSGFRARPGQFLTFHWPIEGRKISRSYSICSSPAQTGYIEITPKRVPNGVVSNFLNDLRAPGLIVEAQGPFGRFYFDETRDSSVLLIAGGSGITPMMSILRHLDDCCLETPATLIYCVKSREEILFHAELKQLAARRKNFRLELVLSQPEGARRGPWGGWTGRIRPEILAA